MLKVNTNIHQLVRVWACLSSLGTTGVTSAVTDEDFLEPPAKKKFVGKGFENFLPFTESQDENDYDVQRL